MRGDPKAPAGKGRPVLPDLHPELSAAERRRLFRQGVDLFNAGRFYDCHESFETIWRSTTPQPRDLHQGLIQVAVGLHHWFHHGRAGAAFRVMARGRRRLAGLAADQYGLPVAAEVESDGKAGLEADPEAALEVDVPSLLQQVDRWLEWLEAGPGEGGPPSRPRLESRRCTTRGDRAAVPERDVSR